MHHLHCVLLLCVVVRVSAVNPVVINTWFAGATQVAYDLAVQNYTALDSIQSGCTYCEEAQCDGTVGWGNHPDTTGETTLDAMIMDGDTMNAGTVAYLRRVRNAITAARNVLHYSSHTVLAGDGATNFSLMMGMNSSNLTSNSSAAEYAAWVQGDCQPNYYVNVEGGNTSCAPYTPVPTSTPTPMPQSFLSTDGKEAPRPHATPKPPSRLVNQYNHDTLGMCVLDASGSLGVGGTTNGMDHKVAGRVSDMPILGAGAYVDSSAGCAAGTGDGDITQRFLPSYQAVESMRQGMTPQAACEDAVRRIMKYYNDSFQIGLVCLDPKGNIGAAGQGWTFTYAWASAATNGTAVAVPVTPLPPLPPPGK